MAEPALVVLGTLLVLAAAQASQSGVEAKAPVDIVNIVGKAFLDNELNFINWCVHACLSAYQYIGKHRQITKLYDAHTEI